MVSSPSISAGSHRFFYGGTGARKAAITTKTLHTLPLTLPSPTALTIGKFEGLHLGHQHLLRELVTAAKQRGLASAVLSFVPHPAQVLSNEPYQPLYTPDEMAVLLASQQIDYWIPYPFDRAFAQMEADAFCRWLHTALRCRFVLVGEGFRFGRGREGTIETLRSHHKHFETQCVPPQYMQGEIISTSRIRALLANGETERAGQLLGRFYDSV